ncbi:histidine kinase [Flavobacterium sp.]|uniref:sensor histidine kinase n=1 Tax=Flavobacterium sp. TaxID=239 RepID=UPI0025C274BD|nr:histidine kinase [Flavobacterium sp.]
MDTFYLQRLFVFSLLIWLVPARAQKVWHDELIRSYQGLPSDIVLKTQTDVNGFLFVATAKGLSRYDGYRFIESKSVKSGITDVFQCKGDFYFHNPAFGLASVGNIHAEPSVIQKNRYEDENPNNDHFENIFLDSRDRIWCSDFSGVKYFSSDKKKLTAFPIGNQKAENLKVQLIETTRGSIWAFTSSGVFVWDEKSNALRKHANPAIASLSCAASIRLSKNRILVATNDNRIFKLDPTTGNLEFQCTTDERAIGFARLPGRAPIAYSRNKIYELGTTAVSFYVPQKSQINHVLADANAEILWVSTNKGLVRLSPVDAVLNYRLPTQISNKVVISMAQDAQNTTWLLDNKYGIWSQSTFGIWKSHDISGVRPKTIGACGNVVLVATDKGVYRIMSDRIEKLNLESSPDAAIKKALLTKKNELWLLCENAPVQRYSWPELQKLTPLSNKPDFWTKNTWNDLFEASDGKIWMCGWAPSTYGIDIFDPKKNAFVEISDLPLNRNRDKFFGDYVNRIAEDDDHNLLFSGYGGFAIVAPNGNLLKKVDVNTYPISDGHFEGIASDERGNIVFATGDGLHVYNKKRDQVLRLSQADGLPSDDLIYGFLKRNDGKIAVGTESGYAAVNLQKLLEPQNKRGLRLSSVVVDGKMRDQESGVIELNKDESDATIAFSDLSFSDRNKVFYRYRFDDENRWNELGNTPEVSLNHISPGTYELLIQKGNGLGDWQSETLELTMIAHPPFYRSPLFYVLCVALMLLCITAVYSYFLNRQRKEARYLQKIREAEMTTLRAQMNPHFMFNTLNSINSYIIQNQTEAASDYLTTFSKLMRNILEYSKEELIPLENELQALKFYMELESMRLEQSFDYTIKIDKEIKGNPLVKIPPLVIQPFVENAIWHGLLHKSEPGNLLISAELISDDKFTVRIEDDGIGREKAGLLKKNQTSHKSYGVEITTERLAMLHPENAIEIIDLKDEKGQPKGTAVILTIKM